jgi:hypothetical protein
MILRITDGTTTVNLAGGVDGIYLTDDYVPRPPEVTESEFTAEAMRDGGELISATRRNVVESVRLTQAAANRAALVTAQHSIETLLTQAQLHQEKGVAAPVYVEYRKADSGDVYRSEILRGTFEPSQETAGEAWWEAASVQATLAWKRRFYWEGPESELSLTNGHGTGTGGVTVYSHDDSGHDNYVAIAGSAVEGVIPAAIRLEMENTYNVSSRAYNVYVGQNLWSNPTTMSHILEGQDVAYGGSSVASSSCSGGYYRSVSWSGDNATYVLRWVLSTAMLNAYAGGWFRMLGRFTTSPTDVKITPKVTFPSGTPLTVVAEAPEATLSSRRIQDLGVLQLPPWLRGETDLYPVDLTLYARKTGGGAFNLDFIQLTPLDGYRVLTPRGYGAAYGITLIDDGISGSVYTTGWGGTAKTGHYLSRGVPIMLWPGRDQRLYFLSTHDTGGSEIERTFSVRVYHRPRRLTL